MISTNYNYKVAEVEIYRWVDRDWYYGSEMAGRVRQRTASNIQRPVYSQMKPYADWPY